MRKHVHRLLALALGACLLLGVTAQAAETKSVTRGEFVRTLYDANKARYGNPGTTDPVAWALNLGVVRGYDDGTIRPDAAITRTQMAVMLYRYAGMTQGLRDKIPRVLPQDTLAGYTDAASVPAWADFPVKWAVYQDLWFSGSSTRLGLEDLVTQAECETAVMAVYIGGAPLEEDWANYNTAAGVQLTMDEMSSSKLTFSIRNTGTSWVFFSPAGALYRKVNGGWYELDGKGSGLVSEYALGPGVTRNYELSRINSQPLSLPAGEYRMARKTAVGTNPHTAAQFRTECRLSADFTLS